MGCCSTFQFRDIVQILPNQYYLCAFIMATLLQRSMSISPLFTKSYLFLFVLLLLLALSSVYVPQVLGEDPGTALAAWQSMLKGSPFNTITTPDHQDLSRSNYLFLTWWTPGHYLLPGYLSQMGISLATASLILTVLFSVLGLLGWYKVYQQLEVGAKWIAFCLIMIASSRLFTINFINYTGGELLIFGGQPWSIYVFLRWRHKPLLLFINLLLISLFCFFLKSSYTIGLAAIGGCAGLFFLQNWRNVENRKRDFMSVIAVFCCCIVYFVVTKWGFLKLGADPTSSQGGFSLNLNSYELLNYPLLQWFNIVDLHQLLPRYINWDNLVVLYHFVSILGILSLWYIVWKAPQSHLKTIFLGFSLIYFIIFLYFFNTGADISLEYRHLKILAYLFLPLLCQYIAKFPNIAKIVVVVFWVANTIYGLSVYFLKKREVHQDYVVGKSGYALRHLNQSDLDFIHAKDDPKHPEQIWFFLPASLNVEVENGRKILSGFSFQSSKMGNFVHDTYGSKSEKIYCVLHRLSSHHFNLNSMFPKYRFKIVKSSPEMLIYEGQ